MKKQLFRPPLRRKNLIAGGSVQHLTNPFERDTTRGTPDNDFPIMHNDDVEDLMEVASCACCGENFGFKPQDKPPTMCPSHRWLEKKELVGHLNAVNTEYLDHGTVVKGNKTTLVYTYDPSCPEWNPEMANILIDAIDCVCDAEDLGVYKLKPYYVPENGTIIIRDVHLTGYKQMRGMTAQIADMGLVLKFLQKLDKVYWEIM